MPRPGRAWPRSSTRVVVRRLASVSASALLLAVPVTRMSRSQLRSAQTLIAPHDDRPRQQIDLVPAAHVVSPRCSRPATSATGR